MKILVTGASGFIGQYVIRNLLQRSGITIVATTRDLEKAAHLDFFHKVQFIETDLSIPDEMVFYKLGAPDIMIHLAWDGLPNYKGQFHIEKNLVENARFIKTMIGSGLKNVNISGTCFEYGMVEGCLREDMVTNPSNPYGQAKDSLRKYIETLKSDFDFSFKWLRLFYMYGDGQAPNSLITQIEKTIAMGGKEFNMSGGEQVRDYLHVNQVANYIVQCSLQNKVEGVINCCSGEPITVKKLVQDYIQEKNYVLHLNFGFYPYPDYEPMAFWGDNTKLNEVLLNAKK